MSDPAKFVTAGEQEKDAHVLVAAEDGDEGTSVAVTLGRLAQRLGVALDCSECCFYEFVPERDTVIPKAMWGLELRDEDRAWVGVENHLHHRPSIAPVFEEHRIVVNHVEDEFDPADPEGMAFWGLKSALYAPMMYDDELLGVVGLGENRARREFSDGDRRLVQGLADVAAVAIANARTSSAAEVRNRHLAALLESSRALGSTMILDEILEVLAEHAANAIGAASSFIYEYLPDQGAVIWRCQYPRDAEHTYDDSVGDIYALDAFPIDLKVIHECAIVAVTIDDPDLDPKSRQDMVDSGETTILSVPLVYGDQVVGLMELCETEYVRQYTEDEVEFMRAIGEQAAVAIRNAQLYRREEWRNERLVRVLDISQVVGGLLDPDEVVEVVCGRLGSVFGDRETAVSVELRDDDESASGDGEGGALREQVDESGSRLVVPLLSKGRPVGDLAIASPWSRRFDRDETELVQIIANQVAVAVENARLYDRLEEQAITDGLTGLYNHRFFYDRLKAEVTRGRRYGFQLSLLMLDLDDFKGFNDEFGHQAGDQVLAEVGRIMREQLRKEVDIPCRYGGEEFAIILPHTPSPGAETVGRRLTERVSAILTNGGALDSAWLTGERVRSTIEGAPFPGRGPEETTHVTVSVGVATYPDQAGDADTLVGNADKALYVAKHRGKNRVELFG
jgi:diguanylate cyclase (GGDEF)-like protein